MCHILLIDGNGYNVLLCYPQKYVLLGFDTAGEAMDFAKFSAHGRECALEQRNSLFEPIKINANVLFDASKFIYFDDLIINILIRQSGQSIDRQSLHKSLNLENLNSLAYGVAAGFFTLNNSKTTNLFTVFNFIGRLYIDCIRRRLKTESNQLTLVVYTSLCSLSRYHNTITKLQITDYRVDFTLSCLLNTYKRLFFNTTSKIITNAIAKLPDSNYLRSTEGKLTYTLYVDFLRELKNFVDEFVPFSSLKGCDGIVLEFVRRHIYVFLNHLTTILSSNVYNLEVETHITLLDGIFYLIREIEKLGVYLSSNFGTNVLTPLSFKRLCLNLGDILTSQVCTSVDQLIASCP